MKALSLSPLQFKRLQAHTGHAFTERLCTLAAQLRPDLVARATPALLREFAQAMTQRAHEHRFSTEFEVATFFAACLLLGKDWADDTRQPLREVLLRTQVEPHLRAVQLLYELERLPPPGSPTAAAPR
jgi:hypothetical protein